jgi:DNA recombination protein RmuC
VDVDPIVAGAIAAALVSGALLGWLAAKAHYGRELAGQTQLKQAFQALSADALRSNNQSFLDLARANLGEFQQAATGELELRRQAIESLVVPIQESLKQVDGKLAEVERERIGAYAALQEQVKAMSLTQQQLQSETGNLVKALRNPTVRGRWGEIQLKRVVEMAGMVDHCDFDEQQTVETEDGRLRPDLVVRLPVGKNVVVDAKTPMAAYLSALEAPDEATRELLYR